MSRYDMNKEMRHERGGRTSNASTVLSLVLAASLSPLAGAGAPAHVESPPEGVPPSTFAREYQACLGPLRSTLARDPGFGREFNPGRHQGTVGEEEFLAAAFGIEDLVGFCGEVE